MAFYLHLNLSFFPFSIERNVRNANTKHAGNVTDVKILSRYIKILPIRERSDKIFAVLNRPVPFMFFSVLSIVIAFIVLSSRLMFMVISYRGRINTTSIQV